MSLMSFVLKSSSQILDQVGDTLRKAANEEESSSGGSWVSEIAQLRNALYSPPSAPAAPAAPGSTASEKKRVRVQRRVAHKAETPPVQSQTPFEESLDQEVKLVPFECPKCGAALPISPEKKISFCSYCGTQLVVDDGSRTVTYHEIDETRIREAELEAELKLKTFEAEQQERATRRKVVIVASIAGLMLMIIGFSLSSLDSQSPVAEGFALSGMVSLLIALYFGIANMEAKKGRDK